MYMQIGETTSPNTRPDRIADKSAINRTVCQQTTDNNSLIVNPDLISFSLSFIRVNRCTHTLTPLLQEWFSTWAYLALFWGG